MSETVPLRVPRNVAAGASVPRRVLPSGLTVMHSGRMSKPIALVTGATAGIGRSFAHQLAARGHDLVLVSRDVTRLEAEAEALRKENGVQVEVLPADLTDRDDVDRVAQRIADTASPVALVVNNAGFGLKETFLENPVDAEQALLDIHVTAVMRLSHAALTAMRERGRGGLINVASVAAFLPRGTYGAAKAWVVSFGEWAAAEYRPSGITVTTLCPGFTRTEFHGRMDVSSDSVPARLWMDVDELVSRALDDHAKGKTLSVPGLPYKAIVNGSRLVPARLVQRFQGWGRR